MNIKKHTCIIIDDNTASLATLTSYIDLQPNLTLLQSFSNAIDAFHFINSNNVPDLIFMDIEMPKMNGIELANSIKHKKKKLVFTTGHTKYGYEAFKLEADAFLLKPFSFTEFAATVQKLFPNETLVSPNQKNHTNNSFFAREKNKLTRVYFNDVIAFESCRHYIIIYTKTKKILTYIALTEIVGLLIDQKEFIQIHRSYIISENHIESVENNNVILDNEMVIPIGRGYREQFYALINKKILNSKS